MGKSHILTGLRLTRTLFLALFFLALLAGNLSGGSTQDGEIANVLLEFVNGARRQNGLPEFVGVAELNEAASKHNLEMLRLNYFSSQSPVPEHETLGQRVALEGLSPERLVQKLFRCEGMEREAISAFCLKSWLEKESFRKRLLSDEFDHIGFGVASDGGVWTMTIIFAGGILETDNSNKPVEAGNAGCKILAQRVLALSNEVRSQHTQERMIENEVLIAAAEAHSEEMLRMNYFSHTSPTPGLESVRQRVVLAGRDPVRVSENLYQCTGYPPEKVPRMAILAWLNSPGHRANLLHSNHNGVGIGVAVKGTQVYVTQVFGGDY